MHTFILGTRRETPQNISKCKIILDSIQKVSSLFGACDLETRPYLKHKIWNIYVHFFCCHIWRFLLLNNEVAWVLLTIVVSLSFKPTLSPLFMSVTFDGKISIPSFISWHCYNVIFSIILSAAQGISWMHNLVFRSSWPSETLLLLYFFIQTCMILNILHPIRTSYCDLFYKITG